MTAATMSSTSAQASSLRDILSNKVIWAYGVLAVLWIGAILVVPGFGSANNFKYLLQTAAFLGIVAVGQTLVVIMGGIDLSVSGVVALSAVVCAQVTSQIGAFAGIIISLFVCAAFGAFNAFGITVLKIPAMVMTLASGTILSGALLIYTNGSPKSASIPLLNWLANGYIGGVVPASFVLWILLALVGVWLAHATTTGRYAFALGSGVPSSRAAGVPVIGTSMILYIACSVLAGVAGLTLLGFTGTSSLTMGTSYQLLSIAAVVLGGTSILGGSGHVIGTSAGALLLTVLTAVLTALNLGEALRQVSLGVLIVVLLIAYAREQRQ